MEVFKPETVRKVYIILGSIDVIALVVGIGAFFPFYIKEEFPLVTYILSVIGATVGIVGTLYLAFLLSIYHTMRYELEEDKLVVRCGHYRDEIKYSEIKKITKAGELGYPVMGGWFRLPGYYWDKYYFLKYGKWVTRYGTDSKKVLLIETEKNSTALIH
ncbi:MAG: PH domain-containing protein [bacterium]